jgi:hypothetical protein
MQGHVRSGPQVAREAGEVVAQPLGPGRCARANCETVGILVIMRQKPAGDELHVFPHQLRPSDLAIDKEGNEWEVIGRPSVYDQGKMHRMRLQKPGDPSVTVTEHWPAHQRVRVKQRS